VFVSQSGTGTPESRARKRVEDLTALLWHIAAFVIINAGIWIQDIVTGNGVDWAYWVTIPWAVGLLIHVLAYTFTVGGFEEKKYAQYLEEERRREPQHH
jgi:hypothetical protein